LVDRLAVQCYNTHMNKTNDILQWTGAVAIVLGHILNAVGPAAYPYNIVVFAVGTVLFLTWAVRVSNRPQTMVNVISLAIGLVGLYKAIG
jgi:energy-converting hydrogenase Eha subunit E